MTSACCHTTDMAIPLAAVCGSELALNRLDLERAVMSIQDEGTTPLESERIRPPSVARFLQKHRIGRREQWHSAQFQRWPTPSTARAQSIEL